MANIKLERPTENNSSVGFADYMNRLLEQIEFMFQNIDEENLTDSFKKKLDKENK